MNSRSLQTRLDRLEAGPGDVVWAAFLYVWGDEDTPLDGARLDVLAKLARREDARTVDIICDGNTPGADVVIPDAMRARLIREAIEEDKRKGGANREFD